MKKEKYKPVAKESFRKYKDWQKEKIITRLAGGSRFYCIDVVLTDHEDEFQQ